MGRRLRLLAVVMFTGTAAACTGSPSTAPPSGGPSTVVQTTTDDALHCYDAIDAIDAVPPDFTVVLDVVALPTGRVLQTAPSLDTDPAARLFAKQGLVVRVGASIDLRIEDTRAGRARIGWGNPGTIGHHVRVEAVDCVRDSAPQWVAFAGGYYVAEPMCLPIVVESGGSREVFQIAVGTTCEPT